MNRLALLSSLLFIGLVFVGRVAAEDAVTPDTYCWYGCQAPMLYVKFAGAGSGPYACGNLNKVKSIFLCARTYCSQHDFDAGYEAANKECLEYGPPYPNTNIIDNITVADVAKIPRLSYGAFPTTPIETVVLPDQHLFDVGYTTVQQFYDVRIYHLWYTYALFIFWGIIIGAATLSNLLTWMRTLSVKSTAIQVSPRNSAGILVRSWTKVRAYVLLPALGRKKCAESVLWKQASIGSRMQSIIVIIFIIINVVLTGVSYYASEENLYELTVPLQTWRYFADRTGYMSYGNLAIFWLFAIRNNVLLWMTGWEFNTFNFFHKWVARISTLQAVLHSIAYTVYSFMEAPGNYQMSWTEQYWYTGEIATIAMALMIGFALRWIRVTWYDFFLLMHIALSLIVLVNLFYHTKIFSGQFDGFLWPCVAFWAFDRVLRIGRVAYAALRARSSRAIVELTRSDDIVRIDVTAVFASRRVRGGNHYFLYSPFTLLGWESHPFTLVRWKGAAGTPDDTPPSSPASLEEKEARAATSAVASCESMTRYSFILRPRKGYTGRLARASERAGGTTAMRFLYEGAYGHAPDLRGYTDILLLIGGSGISVGISAIYDALERNPAARLHLVWSSRTAGLIDGIMERELKHATTSARLTVDAHVTGGSTVLRAEAYRSVSQVRPDVHAAVRAAVDERAGPLAIVVCGPASMMDDGRDAVVQELKAGRSHDVQLFLESFEW